MKMKFKKDSEYDFKFIGEEMILNTITTNSNGEEILHKDIVRIEYTNYTNFSDYNKPYSEEGRSTFYLDGLHFKHSMPRVNNSMRLQAKEYTFLTHNSIIDEVGFKRKKDMINYLENHSPKYIQKLINDLEVTIKESNGSYREPEILDSEYSKEFKFVNNYDNSYNTEFYTKKKLTK